MIFSIRKQTAYCGFYYLPSARMRERVIVVTLLFCHSARDFDYTGIALKVKSVQLTSFSIFSRSKMNM